MIFLYFLGSCSERPTNSSTEDSIIEVTPDEYERIMNSLISDSSGCFLTAHADNSVVDKLDEFFDKTNLYDYGDFVNGYIDYLKNPDYYPEESSPLPVVGKSDKENPVTSTVIPYHYNAYGKERITYPNGTSEIVVCRFDADLSTSSNPAKGHITFTRSNSLGYSTSFGFDIVLTSFASVFNNNGGFTFYYHAIDSNVSGIDRTSIDWKSNILGKTKRVSFYSSLTNDINNVNFNSNSSASIIHFVSDNSLGVGSGLNLFCVSQVFSNDYNFVNSVYNYQNDSRTKSVNVYYNNHAGDTVTTNNYIQYSDYGYTYNDATDSLEFNPVVLAGFFDDFIRPELEDEFDYIFSKMPDINATIKDYTGEFNNLIALINQSTSTSSSSSSVSSYPPVTTGEIYIQMTFPEEFFETYPTLTTDPDISVTTVSIPPHVSYPEDVKHGVEWWVSQATGFLHKSELFDLLLVVISAGIAIYVFL